MSSKRTIRGEAAAVRRAIAEANRQAKDQAVKRKQSDDRTKLFAAIFGTGQDEDSITRGQHMASGVVMEEAVFAGLRAMPPANPKVDMPVELLKQAAPVAQVQNQCPAPTTNWTPKPLKKRHSKPKKKRARK